MLNPRMASSTVDVGSCCIDVEQTTRKTKPMKQSEEERDQEATAAAGLVRPEDVLHRHEDDTGGDQRLDDRSRQVNQVERGKCQGDRMRHGEGGDDLHEVPQRHRPQDQRDEKQ